MRRRLLLPLALAARAGAACGDDVDTAEATEDASAAGEVLLRDPLIAAAVAHSTVLSLPIALDFLVPELAAVVGRLS